VSQKIADRADAAEAITTMKETRTSFFIVLHLLGAFSVVETCA
jgi:hypothetical protein